MIHNMTKIQYFERYLIQPSSIRFRNEIWKRIWAEFGLVPKVKKSSQLKILTYFNFSMNFSLLNFKIWRHQIFFGYFQLTLNEKLQKTKLFFRNDADLVPILRNTFAQYIYKLVTSYKNHWHLKLLFSKFRV